MAKWCFRYWLHCVLILLDFRNGWCEREQERIRYLVEVVPTDDEQNDELIDDESANEIDAVQQRDGGSETEQDISSSETDAAIHGPLCFLRKDQKTK